MASGGAVNTYVGTRISKVRASQFFLAEKSGDTVMMRNTRMLGGRLLFKSSAVGRGLSDMISSDSTCFAAFSPISDEEARETLLNCVSGIAEAIACSSSDSVAAGPFVLNQLAYLDDPWNSCPL